MKLYRFELLSFDGTVLTGKLTFIYLSTCSIKASQPDNACYIDVLNNVVKN